MAGTPQYVDVSSFQGAINWQQYKTWASQWDGISRVVMKSTEGTGYTDPRFHEYRAGALAAGIEVIGYYHYARPEWNSAQAEATWQQSVVGAIRPQDFLMLDYESDVPQATAQWALTWLAQQEAAYGRLPTIYSYPSFIAAHLQDSRLARYPLTYADWQFTPTERPPAPAPWKSYEYLQWSDNATVPGIGSGVDIDLFLGGFSMQSYGPNSADFNQWFTAQDANHWLCKQNGHIVQYGIKGFFSQLSIDGNTLPVVGLPITNEIYLTLAPGKQVVLQVFERAGIYYDPAHLKDHQPGTGDYSLCHLTDQDFLKHVPGLAPLVAKALAEAKKL